MKWVTGILLLFLVSNLWASDHSKYIKGPFKSPQDVTKQCLTCHENSAKEIMKTTHWTWDTPPVKVPGHEGLHRIGKKQSFNNFCINIQSNWPRCTSCHTGYGWKDKKFDFSKEENVDCLICHADPKIYKKNPKGAGYPKKTVDLLAAAKSVGEDFPNRQNCGSCHFYGGGGENVKHGDLEGLLAHPSRDVDVHMSSGMVCQDCHVHDHHQFIGRGSSVSVSDSSHLHCEDCHGDAPHEDERINFHVRTVACQTCHIPTYAKGMATKIWWDWSKAGMDIKPEEEYGRETFMKKKGEFHWGKNLRPEYAWYNGEMERYLLGDTFDPKKVLYINKPIGSVHDSHAKIYPFKVMRGKQIYDAKYNYLIVPHLWGGYWKYFDWDRAAREGMEVVGLPYSGHYGFVETKMYWRINHEVVPKEKALRCVDCHGKNGLMDWEALGYDGDPMQMGDRKQEGLIKEYSQPESKSK